MFKSYERNTRDINKLFRVIGSQTKESRIIRKLLQNNLHKFVYFNDNVSGVYNYENFQPLSDSVRIVVNFNNTHKDIKLGVFNSASDSSILVSKYIDNTTILMISDVLYNNEYDFPLCIDNKRTVIMIDTNSPYENILEQIRGEVSRVVDMTR